MFRVYIYQNKEVMKFHITLKTGELQSNKFRSKHQFMEINSTCYNDII